MSWIKISATLPRSPKILLLADALQCSRYAALGLAVDWLTWLDGATEDGKTFLKPEQINELFSVTFFCGTCHNDVTHTVTNFVTALAKIGWIFVDENGHVCATDFDTHNGENAKRRFANAERQRKSREKRKKNLSQKNVTSVTKKRDQRREEKSIYNSEIPNGSINTVCGGATVTQRPCKNSTPEDVEVVQKFMAAQAVCGLKGEELTTCAMAFFNDCEAVGWTYKGQPILDWQAACRAFLARWQQNKAQRGGAAPASSFTFRSSKKQNYDL